MKSGAVLTYHDTQKVDKLWNKRSRRSPGHVQDGSGVQKPPLDMDGPDKHTTISLSQAS